MRYLFCLVGPDGVGKTTLSHKLQRRLEKRYGPFVVRHMGKSYLPHNRLPWKPPQYIYRAKAEEKKQDKRWWRQWKKRLYHRLANIALSAELTLFFHLRECVPPRKNILMDHCPYDVFVENNRPSFPLLERFLMFFLPRATFIVLLKDKPEAIYARKNQLVPSRIRAYYAHMERVLKRSGRPWTTVWTDKGVAATVDAVEKAIIEAVPSRKQ